MILGMLFAFYKTVEPGWSNSSDLKDENERLVARLERAELPTGFTVPPKFVEHVDRDGSIAFGYPRDWLLPFNLQSFSEDPVRAAREPSPTNFNVVVESLEHTYPLGYVSQIAKASGIPAARVRDVLGVELSPKTAQLEIPLDKFLSLLGVKG